MAEMDDANLARELKVRQWEEVKTLVAEVAYGVSQIDMQLTQEDDVLNALWLLEETAEVLARRVSFERRRAYEEHQRRIRM